MSAKLSNLELDSGGLRLKAELVPWDSEALGFPVAQISNILVNDSSSANGSYQEFQCWLNACGVGVVSCRLPHEFLRESMFLESQGFRFVEMVMHPALAIPPVYEPPAGNLKVEPAVDADLPELRRIAERAFSHERFHVDPRIDRRLGDERYARWVVACRAHPRQRLLKVTREGEAIALFIVEAIADRSILWQLTAVSPEWQGRGYGRQAWRAMLHHHSLEGMQRVSTTVSVRNVAALNLYSVLGFRFLPPEMTFHWVREER